MVQVLICQNCYITGFWCFVIIRRWYYIYLQYDATATTTRSFLLVWIPTDTASATRTNGLVEHRFETLLRQRRALHVLDGTNLFRHLHALFVRHGGLALGFEFGQGLGILSQIQLGADQDQRSVGAVV